MMCVSMFCSYGDLQEMIAVVAAATRAGETIDAPVVVVWNHPDSGDDSEPLLNELFSHPQIQMGCFPGLSRVIEGSDCPAQYAQTTEDWQHIAASQPEGGVCVKSTINLLNANKGDLRPFYKSIRPSNEIMEQIEAFKQSVSWDSAGYWIGIRIKANDGHKETDLSKYVEKVRGIFHTPKYSGRAHVLMIVDDEKTENAVSSILRNTISALDGTNEHHMVGNYGMH